MVRRACSSLILGVLLTTSSAAFAPAPVFREPPKPKAGELFAALQGTWDFERNVNKEGKGKRVQYKIRIQDTSWSHVYNNNGIETKDTEYRIVLDPKASPATFDLVRPIQIVLFNGGMVIPEQIVMKGILEIEGDTLTFCYANGYQENAERPKHFIVGDRLTPKGWTMTMTLKRVR